MDLSAEQRQLLRNMRAMFPNGGMGNHVVLCPKFNTIYLQNEKAGCSTIKLLLHRAHTGDWSEVTGSIHSQHQLPVPRDIGWPTVLDMLTSGSTFRFTFVRHPIDRLVSAYSDKIVRVRYMRAQIQELLGERVDPDATVPFDMFMAALTIQEPLQMDPHWRPQHLNIMHGLIESDFIGRLENFDEDIAVVKQRAGLPDVPVEVRNQQRHADVFTDRRYLKRVAEKIYARDFELFGY